jgi:hypothetical protein
MKSSLNDTDKGYRALMKRLQENVAPSLRVGVFGARADVIHEDSTLTVGDIATMHEFGFEHVRGQYYVLERSWLRGYYDENQARLQEMVRRVAEAVAQGKMTREQGLNLLGLKIAGEIKQRLQAGITPPLAESTVKAKGSSVPLIDSGQFVNSIAHEVTGGGSE